MYDVTAMGELLIDFVQNGESPQGNLQFEANPGGAPCNVLAMLARLGYQTAFIGKVGNDFFGKMLGKVIEETGIDASGLVYDEKVNTTLALVHTLADGDRDFSFYRKPGADIMLNKEEVNYDLIKDSRIFHFGSLSLTDQPANYATREAVVCAERAGKLISFDPNLRPPLWDDLEDARYEIWYGIGQCDILKIADNEIQWLTGEKDFDAGVKQILRQSNARMVNVTLGREGSISYYEGKKVFVPAFVNETTVDTTGAGDTFCACVLGYVLKHGLDGLTEENLREMLLFANGAASIVTTRKGAVRSMPGVEEIEEKIGKM